MDIHILELLKMCGKRQIFVKALEIVYHPAETSVWYPSLGENVWMDSQIIIDKFHELPDSNIFRLDIEINDAKLWLDEDGFMISEWNSFKALSTFFDTLLDYIKISNKSQARYLLQEDSPETWFRISRKGQIDRSTEFFDLLK